MLKTVWFVIFLTVLTAGIVILNPKPLKTVVIGDSNLAFLNTDTTKNKDLKVADKNTLTAQNKIKAKSVEQAANPQKTAVKNTDTNTFEKLVNWQAQLKEKVTEPQKTVQKTTQPKVQPAKKQTQTAKSTKPAQKTVQKKVSKPAPAKTQPAKKTTTSPKTTTPKTTTAKTTPAPAKTEKKPTEYEETILWNKWRADVANSVTKNVSSNFIKTVPSGTIYTYSFNVNNKKQISNVFVKVSKGYINSNTNQGALMIRQAIEALNQKSVLKFPNGTQRTSVTVSSGIQASSTSVKLQASAFNDVETVKKQR